MLINEALVVGLIQNAALLLAMVTVFDFLLGRRDAFATPQRQAAGGLAIGLIAGSMIFAAVPLESGLVFDTRSVLLAVTGLFLGPIPTLIAVGIAMSVRVAIGGINVAAILITLSSGATGLVWRRLRTGPLTTVTWRELYGFGLAVHAVMLGLILTAPSAAQVLRSIALPVGIIYPLATVVVGALFVERLRRQAAAVQLERSESRFRLLAENAIDVIFRYEFTPRRGFTYVSPSALSFTGYTPEEHYADPDLGFKLVHPEDKPLLAAAARGETEAGEPLILRWIRKDGEVIWAEQRITYFRGGDGEILALEGIARDITARKRAEAMIGMALVATNQGFYDLNVPAGEAQVSDEYARMLGYEPSQFRETHEAWVGRLHPDDREAAVAAYEAHVSGRSAGYRVEARQRTATGQWRWILSLGSVVSRDAAGRPLRMLGTCTDITALKNAEQQTFAAEAEASRLLAEAEESRRALLSLLEDQQRAERELFAAQQLAQSTLDALTEHICVVDVAGRIIAVNQAWREFGAANGASPAAMLPGANYLEVCSAAQEEGAEQAREFATALRGVLAGRIDDYSMEYACHSADEQRWFVARVTRFAGGGPARLVIAHQDITARRRAEEERLELTAQLHHAQKLESLGSLAGGVAHDINNVLAAILAITSARRRRLGETDPLARSLDTITNACVRGRSVVRSLLYFAREDFGSKGPVDLNAIAREIVQLLDNTTLKRIRLTTDLDPALPCVEGDAGALSHAVMNLCVNAVDAMPDGGSLELCSAERNGFVWITVRDTGTGMTPEVRQKAIDPFFTTKPVGKGTGLGLAMVFGTVKAHGGTLEIESTPGQGTEVRLAFPAGRQPECAPAPEGSDALPAESPSRLRILLVDDDSLVRDAICELLTMEGHQVVESENGADAIERIAAGLDPDLVILDMNMPGLTGAQTLEEILRTRPAQRVLMCSGHTDEEIRRLAARHASVQAISKPFTLEELERRLTAFGLATAGGG